ncbi:hypothetical protein CPCC7001_2648 [Cyanobium sp. PCC 7001]|uniref:hypothetical protein n=1 Tax=Cyanobium sp. PCC 7001 TaxID=180281 RepID=UPI00018048D3|nr:hypothetical protein [Cyanobium sp. PCC 7001]EDY39767.1 hypothetical protein CPCC7001_2648 [Cyanobium sp. PCC 7001]
MSRILWCGGSHLANAKCSAIEELHAGLLKAYVPDYYITAAPANRNWSAAGGRYRVEGTTVTGNRTMSMARRNLQEYAAIIFVGQWIQPWFAFRDGLPLSEAVLRLSLESLPLHPMITRRGRELRWYNEPLALFPTLTSAKVILIRDPEACMDSYRLVPKPVKQRFGEHLEAFCRSSGLLLCPQFTDVLDRDHVTQRRYLRSSDGQDPVHMSDTYWRLLFDRLLAPLLKRHLALE